MAQHDHALISRPARANIGSLLRRHSTMVLGALCFALALALRLYRLGAQSLWLDEGGTWAEVTRKGWGALIAELWSTDAAYPLYHVLLKGWVAIAGDSEWALRSPSALAGAGAVLVIYLAALELFRTQDLASAQLPASVAGLLLAGSPFALWYSQDAKVYSLLILIVALELWALLRALRLNTPHAWLLLLALIGASVFVHRLALLVAAATAFVYLLIWPPARRARPIARWALALLAAGLTAASVVALVSAAGTASRGGNGHIPAGPLQGLWLTLIHFSLDRGDIAGYAGLPALVWLLPCAALALWGAALLLRDARRRSGAALAVLSFFLVPLLLLVLALAFKPIYSTTADGAQHLVGLTFAWPFSPAYEPRYATIAFPAWALLLAAPFGWLGRRTRSRPAALASALIGAALLLANTLVLLQPKHGIFSGDPVKEQWNSAITDLAREVHPDDLVILHPYFVQPLWDYYAPRVTPDPLPQPVTFATFAAGHCEQELQAQGHQAVMDCIKRDYNDLYFNKAAAGKKRALLLIAPDHASIVDPPLNPPQDEYGLVGLRFQYASEEHAWPCGGAVFVGIEIKCASYPDFFGIRDPKTAIPEPGTPLRAVFGGELGLRGYQIDPLGGKLRPGGSLPITLYWAAEQAPSHDYTMFLHLCRDCSLPPLAQDDRRPLNGYEPAGRTTTWQTHDPVHDERTIALPASLPPGRYTLLLGVYPAGLASPTEADRLPVVSDATVLSGQRLVLGEVTIGP